jgi:integrase
MPAARYKSERDMLVPLSAAARALLDKIPAIAGADGNAASYVFTNSGQRPISGFSRFKREFDQQCGVSDWRPHDLRRASRSLMSRAGVPPDDAERCSGHAIIGVRATYDKHEFRGEKRDAFGRLAALFERIVDPQANVVEMHKAAV